MVERKNPADPANLSVSFYEQRTRIVESSGKRTERIVYEIKGCYFGGTSFSIYVKTGKELRDMGWICFFSGFMFGGLVGVVVMCVLQINRTNRLERE